MRKLVMFACCTMVAAFACAQQVQWAYKVLDFSSQKEDRSFSAQQAIGKPNVLPGSGENKNAWQPNDGQKKKEEFIKVGFLNPIKAKQILIGESLHPGFVSK